MQSCATYHVTHATQMQKSRKLPAFLWMRPPEFY